MLVYVSGPYSGVDYEAIDRNIEQSRHIATVLWERGHAALCPHLNTAHFETDCDATYEQYINGDLLMLARCDAIVMTPNWESSNGANIEKSYADRLGIPVYYYPDLPEIHATEIRCPKQAQRFAEIVGQMYRTHLQKNSDYSPANILATGEIGLVTRLWDKIARLMNLIGFRVSISASTYEAPKQPKNESINDTYMDAAVYAIIGLLLREGSWGK